MALYPVQTVS